MAVTSSDTVAGGISFSVSGEGRCENQICFRCSSR
jgi:hypothetical protein